jgi:hypothetical protein
MTCRHPALLERDPARGPAARHGRIRYPELPAVVSAMVKRFVKSDQASTTSVRPPGTPTVR